MFSHKILLTKFSSAKIVSLFAASPGGEALPRSGGDEGRNTLRAHADEAARRIAPCSRTKFCSQNFLLQKSSASSRLPLGGLFLPNFRFTEASAACSLRSGGDEGRSTLRAHADEAARRITPCSRTKFCSIIFAGTMRRKVHSACALKAVLSCPPSGTSPVPQTTPATKPLSANTYISPASAYPRKLPTCCPRRT